MFKSNNSTMVIPLTEVIVLASFSSVLYNNCAFIRYRIEALLDSTEVGISRGSLS